MPSTIPVFYEDDDPQGERHFSRELAAWVGAGSDDLRLMVVRQMNWDSMDVVIADMVADSTCDIAIIAHIFWAAEPSYFIENPDRYVPGNLIDTILDNVRRGHYQKRVLLLHRLEVLHSVQTFAAAARRRLKAGLDLRFEVPAALIGPFPGRPPQVPPPDHDTAAHLTSIFAGLGGAIETDHDVWARQYESNFWIRHYIRLPPASAPTTRDGLEGIEEVYGRCEDYQAARARLQADMPYLGRPTPISWWQALRWRRTQSMAAKRPVFTGL